jgi:flagellar basal body rod protein FlgB
MTINSLTVGAVGLALDMAQRRAEVASRNIALTNVPGSRMERPDFAAANDLLGRVAQGDAIPREALGSVNIRATTSQATFAVDGTSTGTGDVDDQVADLARASAHFQALSEALNRQFGLMSIALSGDQS